MWIRPIEKTDIPALAELEKTCFTDPWNENMLTDMLNNKFDETYLVEDCGKTIGYVNLRTLGDESELMRICIAPDARGNGYSKLLMERALVAAKTNNASKIFLEVRESNAPAIGLYNKYRFAEMSRRAGYYTNPIEDAVVMQLLIFDNKT